MNRRTFFSWLGGLLGTAATAKATESTVETPYTYDWSGSGWTDDPWFKKGLLRGGPHVHQVFLNGEDVSHLPIVVLRTGQDGYVIHLVRRGNGFVTEVWNNWEGRWQELGPDEKYRVTDPVRGEKYGEERAKRVTLYGSIEYRPHGNVSETGKTCMQDL